MFENRSLKLDLFSLALLVAAGLMTAALLTYDATDPPSTLVYPPKPHIDNACGRAGAYAAHALFTSVGYAAVYVVGSLAAVAMLLVLRREIDQPVLRGFGWATSLAALATLATMALPNTSPGPEIGAGGYLGAMGHALLESHFAALGAYVLALAVLLSGLLLATDYLLLRFATATTLASGVGIARAGRIGGRIAGLTALRPKTDLEGEFDEEEDEDADGEEEEYEYEYEEDEEEDAEWEEDEDAEEEGEEADSEPLKVRTPATKEDEPAAEESPAAADQPTTGAAAVAKGLKGKLSSALRIKNPNTKRNERDEIIDQLEAADQEGVDDLDYQLPPLDLLLPSEEVCYEDYEQQVRRRAKVLEKTFKDFGFDVKVVEIETGPVIAQYELALAPGLKLSKITGLADDIAVALRVPGVRIVAPIPGKNSVGIEVPNETRQLVRLREVIEETNGRAKRMKIPIYLGKDVTGNSMVVDLASLPHLLIAGRTGTGKSVCLNSIIVSILMSRGPDEVRMLMIDPKMVELSGYKKLPHLMHPVVTDMRKAEAILAWSVDKMEERYQLLARAGVRQVSVYNQLSEEELRERIVPTSEAEWETIPKSLPYIVIVADEMADLIMTCGKEVQEHIIRLAQKSRAVGIHLILATQKPTVDVITGLIKSNLPARIAFQVASRTDSQVVLDANGADKLLGNGDMLFLSPGTSQLLRGQGTYLSDDEITEITDFVGTEAPQFAKELIELKTREEQEAEMPNGISKDRDDLYEAAVDIVIREQRGSVSLLQRCLGIGYGRAARLIDFMAEDGIVSDYNGSKAREVVMTLADWEAMNGEDEEEPAPDEPVTAVTAPPKPKRATKIVPEPVDAPTDDESDDDSNDDDSNDETDEAEDLPPRRSGRSIRIDTAETERSFGGEPGVTVETLQAASVAPAMGAAIAPWEDDAVGGAGSGESNETEYGAADEDDEYEDDEHEEDELEDEESDYDDSETDEDDDSWEDDEDDLEAEEAAEDDDDVEEEELAEDEEWEYEDEEEEDGEDDDVEDDEEWEYEDDEDAEADDDAELEEDEEWEDDEEELEEDEAFDEDEDDADEEWEEEDEDEEELAE